MLNKQLKLNKISRANVLSSGFTLIELLVVIVILAILAVAVIVAINPAQRIAAANNSTIKSNLGSYGSSAAAYSAQYGGYPTEFLSTGGSVTAGPVWPIGSSAATTYVVAGVTYTYTATPPSCNSTSAPCTDISISAPVNPGDGSTGLWCFQSKIGTITNPTVANGCAP